MSLLFRLLTERFRCLRGVCVMRDSGSSLVSTVVSMPNSFMLSLRFVEIGKEKG